MNNKKVGLIIDVKAKSSFSICEKVNQYLNIEENIFPWDYTFNTTTLSNKFIKIHSLQMNVDKVTNVSDKSIKSNNNVECDLKDLIKKFIRTIPNQSIYKERLKNELFLLEKKKLIPYLLRALQILDMTKNIPHVTRGSCGSSLVCYLLGISHVDPVRYNINFARFLNEHRNSLPDIDFDFPYNLRDEVFLKIELQWPGKIARISNHVYYHEKSATRQALRNIGIRKFIGKNELHKEISKMTKDEQLLLKNETKKIDNTFRGYSLHCGGIVYYPDGVPEELILHSTKNHILPQISLNKVDVAKDLNFKIDILSSRALAIIFECHKYKQIDFGEFTYDKQTFDMLCKGDNFGIVLAESPLMSKALKKVKPQSIYDLAVCLAIIRPAAKDARYSDLIDAENSFIFDDDAIDIISKELSISCADADKYRRGFAKKDKKIIKEFTQNTSKLGSSKQKEILQKLKNLSKYGFCKAHAFSYAQLIWKLAVFKCHIPTIFWKAVLNHSQSSYKKWVHYCEASYANVNIRDQCLSKNDVSIYANNRRKKIITLTHEQQLKKYGYWHIDDNSFFPNCFVKYEKDIVILNGIIACSRVLANTDKKEKSCVLFIGVGKQTFIEVIANSKKFNSSCIGITGKGKIIVSNKEKIIEMITFNFY